MDVNLQMLSPILWTKDLQGTIDFYVQKLGFKSQSNFPNFASLMRDEVQIMVIIPNPPEENDGNPFFPKPVLTGSLYIFTKNIDAFWKEIKDKVQVKEPICDREYMMRDFGIVDNNGYEIVFGEDISGRN